MTHYLNDLVDRMLDDTWGEGVTSSEETTSWKAYREAEAISDKNAISELIKLITNEKNTQRRSKMYWILGKITQKIRHHDTLQFMINQLANEQENEVIISILSTIENIEKPAHTNLSPIFHLVKHHKGKFTEPYLDDTAVKGRAINTLSLTQNPDVEPFILEILQEMDSEDSPCVWYCLQVLQNIGSRASIPLLKAFAGHKKTDFSASALFILLKVGDEREIPIFEKYIQEGRNKDVSLYALCKIGNEHHIPLIIKRMKENLSRKRSCETFIGGLDEEKSEITHGIEFLAKYQSENTEIQKFLATIKDKKWDKLFEKEQNCLLKHFPELK